MKQRQRREHMDNTVLSVVFESATSSDVDTVVSMVQDFYSFLGLKYVDTVAPAVATLSADKQLGHIWLIKAEPSGEIAGYMIATYLFDIEYGGRCAFITDLYLKDNFRGSGIGRKALDVICEQSSKDGAHAVHLEVRHGNDRALRLYESYGFELHQKVLMTKLL